MCYYNGQKVTHAEFIRLKQLEKALAKYDFLTHDLNIGFEYGLNAVLKPMPDKEDFDLVQMVKYSPVFGQFCGLFMSQFRVSEIMIVMMESTKLRTF